MNNIDFWVFTRKQKWIISGHVEIIIFKINSFSTLKRFCSSFCMHNWIYNRSIHLTKTIDSMEKTKHTFIGLTI